MYIVFSSTSIYASSITKQNNIIILINVFALLLIAILGKSLMTEVNDGSCNLRALGSHPTPDKEMVVRS